MGKEQERQEVAEFVKELYVRGHFESWGEFARDVGVLPSTISDWHRAVNAPSGYKLLRLMRAAQLRADTAPEDSVRVTDPVRAYMEGLIRLRDEELERLEAERESSYARLRSELEAIVARQTAEITRGYRALAEEVRALPHAPAPEAPQAKGEAS